jgi:hypothetical protein
LTYHSNCTWRRVQVMTLSLYQYNSFMMCINM